MGDGGESRARVPSPDVVTPASPVIRATRGRGAGGGRSILDQLGPPRLSYADLQAVLAESERPIREWLDANESRVRALSLAAATEEVIRALPETAEMGTGGVASAIQGWARERGIRLPTRSLAPHPADEAASAPGGASGAGFIERIRRIVEGATGGTAIVSGEAGELRISATGATGRLQARGARATAQAGVGGVSVRAEGSAGSASADLSGAGASLRTRSFRAGARITWDGSLAVTSSVGDLHFRGQVSRETWSLRLTFPRAEMPQDLSALASVFSNGADALGAIARETATFESLEEIPDLAGRISPHVAPVRQAVRTAQRIARTPVGVSFGVEVGGPTRPPGPEAGPDAPRGVEARAVLTIRF